MRALLALLAVLCGCARAPRVPPSPPPPAGYERRVDDPALAEAASLAGRRIALDPGHGGFFRGALGKSGLTEAEVNLGVALLLRDRLLAAGAEVLMTRTLDRDFLAPADSALRTDLNSRVAMSEAFRPDAFVSIHHNADARGRGDVNETITFYKLGDDGPSLELAQDVHRALVRHVGIQPQRVTPGNFAVLRGSSAPAILTETSYITYPPTEARLRLPEAQQIEAEALFVGLARYFARPVPVVEEFVASDGMLEIRAGGAFFPIGDPVFRGRIRGTFDRLSLRVSGREVPVTRTGDRFFAVPDPPLPSGQHEAVLKASLAGQGTGRPARLHFELQTCGALAATVWKPGSARRGQVLPIRLDARDAAGRPDSGPDTLLEIRVLTPRLLVPAETTVTISRGEAWFYPRLRMDLGSRGRAPHRARLRVKFADGCGVVRVDTLDLSLVRGDGYSEWMGWVREMPADQSLRRAPGTGEPLAPGAWINRDGFAALQFAPREFGPGRTADSIPVPPASLAESRLPALAGYRAWASNPPLPPRFTAILGGALHRRRITLDPDGGGEQSGGAGPGGTRGSDLNLAVARALRGMLEAAGAEVMLTRDGDYAMSEVERVQRSESFRADRFVRIGHKAEAPHIGHYFSSEGGKAWAIRTGQLLAALGLPAPPAAEDAQYPIQQTSCPSLYAGFARVDSAAEESRLLAPGTLRAEAYALYLAIAREWSDGAGWTLDSLEVRSERGEPAGGAPVTLGGALVLETDAFGRVRFFRTEAGPIEAEVDDPRVRARIVLLDSARASTLTGPPGR